MNTNFFNYRKIECTGKRKKDPGRLFPKQLAEMPGQFDLTAETDEFIKRKNYRKRRQFVYLILVNSLL